MVIIKRKLLGSLIEHLKREELSLIVGPRQVGKTTLMELLKGHIETNTLHYRINPNIASSKSQ